MTIEEMNKPANIRRYLKDTLTIAYATIGLIQKEIQKLGLKDFESSTPQQQEQVKNLTHMLTLVNNVIHPLHNISRAYMQESEWPLVDYCKTFQELSIKENLIDPCYCSSCKEKETPIENNDTKAE